jgi:hypothetical protein
MHTVTATITSGAGRPVGSRGTVLATDDNADIAHDMALARASENAGWIAMRFGTAVVTLSTGEVFTLTCTS